MKTRYKVLIWIAVLAVAYVAVAVAAWRIMPAKIADAESKRPGITMALAKVANDQLAVSRRISEITKRTLGNGQDKAAQVAMLLGDDELNRFALTYMGADWATMHSSFSGNVKHMRDLLKMQKSDRDKYVSKLNQKIKELENRKAELLQKQKHPNTWANRHVNEQWRLQLEDVDRQLWAWRSSNTYREYVEKDKLANSEVEAKANTEAAIFKLASEYEAQTVGQLVSIMAEQATALRYEEAEPERMRHKMSYFNIWPLNKLAAMPL